MHLHNMLIKQTCWPWENLKIWLAAHHAVACQVVHPAPLVQLSHDGINPRVTRPALLPCLQAQLASLSLVISPFANLTLWGYLVIMWGSSHILSA